MLIPSIHRLVCPDKSGELFFFIVVVIVPHICFSVFFKRTGWTLGMVPELLSLIATVFELLTPISQSDLLTLALFGIVCLYQIGFSQSPSVIFLGSNFSVQSQFNHAGKYLRGSIRKHSKWA